ncbi:MAG: hypothetical protein WD795_08845 [Woeseia sp.]
MDDDNRPTRLFNASDVIDRSKREAAKSVGLLLLTASLGLRVPSYAVAASTDGSSDVAPQPWGDPSTLVSVIAAGTLAVPSVAETVDAYTKGFGYVELWRGRIPPEIADFWGTPAMADRIAAVVGPPEHDHGLIRIVELGDDFQQADFHETLGWVALEIRVRSPDVMVSQLKGLPFVHAGGPGDSSTKDGAPSYRAAQFKGPSGEPLYFTQHAQLDSLLALGPNNVGPLFIQTLAARPYRETRDFYLKTLAMKSRMEVDVRRTNLANRFSLPEDRLYKMAAVRAPEYCSIQIDEYPEAINPRPSAHECLVPGACMCTFATQDLDLIASALRQSGLPFSEIDSHSMLPSTGRRALACRGYSGEIVEFIER